MAGSIHPVIAVDHKFRGYLPDNGWCLCLGAGISKGICPEWQDLAHNVVNEAFSLSLSESEFTALVVSSGWSLDSWIQAAANEFFSKGKSIEAFNELIEAELYSNILKQSRGLGLEKYLMSRKIVSLMYAISLKAHFQIARYFRLLRH